MIGKSDDTGEFFNARKIVKNKIPYFYICKSVKSKSFFLTILHM